MFRYNTDEERTVLQIEEDYEKRMLEDALYTDGININEAMDEAILGLEDELERIIAIRKAMQSSAYRKLSAIMNINEPAK